MTQPAPKPGPKPNPGNSNSQSNSNSNANSGSGSNAYTDTSSQSWNYGHNHNGNGNGNDNSNGNWNGNANGNANLNGNLNANGNANLNGNLNANGNANLSGNANHSYNSNGSSDKNYSENANGSWDKNHSSNYNGSSNANHSDNSNAAWNSNSNYNHTNVDVEANIKVKVNLDVDIPALHQLMDNDINDLDVYNLINAAPGSKTSIDDFTVRELSVGNSFNDAGNDTLTRVNQSNQLRDNDTVSDPSVTYSGPDGAEFQKVDLKGGDGHSGTGTDGHSSANYNDGNGSVSGSSSASGSAIGSASAFTQDLNLGSNTQANQSAINLIGGNSLRADDVSSGGGKGPHGGPGHGGPGYGGPEAASLSAPGDGGGSHSGSTSVVTDYDNDVNDIDVSNLINVASGAELSLDDFTLDITSIGNSFNGAGNDTLFDVNQVNDLVDQDSVYSPNVGYNAGPSDYGYPGDGYQLLSQGGEGHGGYGKGGGYFQDVKAVGGWAGSGNGISGSSDASNNGGNGSISGVTSAAADANVSVEAFTQNIVLGANLQLNNSTITVVGGDSTIADNIHS